MNMTVSIVFFALFLIAGLIINKANEKQEKEKQQEQVNTALAKHSAQQGIKKTEALLKERKKQLADEALKKISGAKAILRVEETACGQLFVTFVSHDNKRQQTVV